MSTDWSWTFASEYGRDRILRDRLEDLEVASSSARSEASRLRASLARTQGSIETRLSALSRAFDAYVELGDVREQLSAFTGTAEIRRHALRAVEALGQGRRPDPLPHDDTYWLVPAITAVVARADGRIDVAAETRAAELDRDAELFEVVTLGMLGHGASVADRVPALLVTDTGLTVEQQALWQAVLEGTYGDVLPAVRASFAPALQLDADGVEMWRAWLLSAAPGADRVGELAWLRDQLTVTEAAADPGVPEGSIAPSAVDRLKAVAARLIAEGRSDERDLLARAQELRAMIEDPNAPTVEGEERARAEEISVAQAVQEAIAGAQAGSATRLELLSWLSPVLAQVVDQIVAQGISGPTTIVATTPGGRVEVSAAGADPAEVQRAKSSAADTPSNSGKRIGLTVGAGALVVLAIILFATGSSTFAVILALAGAAVGIAAGLAWREGRELHAQRAEDVAQVDRAIGAATARAATVDAANAVTAEELQALNRELTACWSRLSHQREHDVHEGGPA